MVERFSGRKGSTMLPSLESSIEADSIRSIRIGLVSTVRGKIAKVLLKRIRALETPAPGDSVARTGLVREAARSVSVRQAQFSDFGRVCALNLRLGQGPDSEENWRRLWFENPALADGRGASPIGWVLEASHEIVGFLGSIPLEYEFEGFALRAAATCRFAVDPPYRAFSHLLVVSFFRQKNVDLFLNSTATVAAGKIMTALKASPLPQPDYGNVLFWVLNPHHFAKGVLKKLGVKASLIEPGAAVASLVMKGDMAIRKRAPRGNSSGCSIRETSVHEFGPEFEQLWSESSKGNPRLLARRTPEILRWHFDPPGNRRITAVLSGWVENKLAGYLIVRHEPRDLQEIRRSLVADLLIKDSDPQILEPLFAAALGSAKKAGSDILEVMGFPDRIRQTLLQWGPYSRQYPACPFFFKARNQALHQRLTDKNAWYACPYDGDATLWP
jgi:hypothetical protein